jgi:large subunit ribosomal protein LP0
MSAEETKAEVDVASLTGKRLKKYNFRQRLNKLFDEYKSILIISIDNVGSRQMQLVRIALRGQAVMLMGKNTMIRSVIRDRKDQALNALLPHVVQNVGFVFTNGNLNKVKTIIEENKVPAAAKAGGFAPADVFVPPGPTGMDPGQTAFFQSLGIATKIERGNIAITSEVHLLKVGDKITASHVMLLQKMNIMPFFYGIGVNKVYENGSVFDAAVLSLSKADLLGKFMSSVAKIAALSFETGYPTIASVPFQMRYAFKKCIALSMESGYSFKLMKKWMGEGGDDE